VEGKQIAWVFGALLLVWCLQFFLYGVCIFLLTLIRFSIGDFGDGVFQTGFEVRSFFYRFA
jgi:hypothetical protein